MNKFILALAVLIQTAYASGDFCRVSRDRSFAQFQLEEKPNRLAFKNQGGFFNAGVCWWHSRFTRNATYLAKYNPSSAVPSKYELENIVKALRKGNEVVTIDGYESLEQFSLENKQLIQSELEAWQRYDGIIRQQWIVGLWGVRQIAAHKMRARMEHLYDYVHGQKNIAYMKLQLKGIPAHSWLVVNMEKLSNGYRLKIIDSNYKEPLSYEYRYGDKSFTTKSYGRFVPYLGKRKEAEKIRKIRSKFCRAELKS